MSAFTVLNASGQRVCSASPRSVQGGGALEPQLRLSAGVYIIELCLNNQRYRETFCIGSFEENAARLLERTASLRITENPDVLAISRRLAALSIPKKSQDRSWEVKAVHALEELDALLEASSSAGRRQLPAGLHFLGLKSRIDESLQCYRLYVPEQREARKQIPLVVFLPTVASAARPFIESAFVAAHQEAEKISAFAERDGAAVLWVGYHSQPSGAKIDLVHLDEVLQDVAKRVEIDISRIVLIGSCSGGALGTLAIAEWPQRFAGLAFLDPVFVLEKTPSDSGRAYFADQALFTEWLSDTDSSRFVQLLRDTPILMIYDGAQPGHGSLKIAEGFTRLARQAGARVEFLNLPQPLAQHMDAWRRTVDWSVRQRRTTVIEAPKKSSDERECVMDALSSPFLLVEGTSGTDIDRAATQSVVRSFESAWRELTFGSCRIRKDIEITEEETRQFNLVLVGNEKTNCLISRYASGLFSGNTITVSGRKWSSPQLTVQVCIENPFVSQRRIVVLGAIDMVNYNAPIHSLLVDGWFTSAVWTGDPGQAELVEVTAPEI
ncbi:hypothetical protein DB347_18000 [Opitutaceae bacterium EW11]|nr:hypothetical protein DB347_18000 [Opitutaceae bacterium EW11]